MYPRFKVPVYLIILVCLVFQFSFAQTIVITGKVSDIENNNPVPEANVYLSGTMLGSSTNSEGEYKIVAVPPGTYELVISVIGFHSQVHEIEIIRAKNIIRDIKLEQKLYETDEIAVDAEVPFEWHKDLEFFESYFLGSSAFIDSCEIMNKEVLNFNKTRTSFSASSEHPLTIINTALGYKIQCELMHFFVNREKEEWEWKLKPWFTELKSNDPERVTRWQENRAKVYVGSLNHFLYNLVNDRCFDEGYNLSMSRSIAMVDAPLKNSNYFMIDSDFILTPESSESYKLSFKDFLKVKYSNGQTSYIKITNHIVFLNKLGKPFDVYPFKVFGFWAQKGMADLLPENYRK
jgi:hypothetical protein